MTLEFPSHDQFLDNQNPPETIGEAFYKRLKVYQGQEGKRIFSPKFPYSLYLEEQNKLKSQLLDALEENFKLLKFEKEFDAQLEELRETWMVSAKKLGILEGESNFDLVKKRLIKEKNIQVYDQLNELHEEVLKEFELNELKLKKVRDISFGTELVAFIGALNDSNNITPQQLANIMSNGSLTAGS